MLRHAYDHVAETVLHLAQRARPQLVVKLAERVLQLRPHRHPLARQRPAQLAVVVAQQPQAAAGVDQLEHQAQRAGAVRAAVDQVSELHQVAVRGRGVAERAQVAVHVADHPQRGVRWDHAAAGPASRCGAGGLSRWAIRR